MTRSGPRQLGGSGLARRDFIFICTVCEPMHCSEGISSDALLNLARNHSKRHGLGYYEKNQRIITVVSSPVDGTDTPELEGLLRWENHERTKRSSIDLEEAGEEGPD